MVTGVDLVREQLDIAATGRPTVREATVGGAAIECRVNAEDPVRGFLPTPGLVEVYSPPGGPFTRVDGFAYPGLRVPRFYDPLLAKITMWAPDRDQAIARMERALGECRLSGPGLRTTIDFARDVLARPLFRTAKHTTGLVDDMIAQRTSGA
jgi:acetyl-CoA carboxylase biotin carboxylase subunit